MPSTNPNSPKQIKTPVRTLAAGLLIDSTGRVVGRGSTDEDAALIAEALNFRAVLNENIARLMKSDGRTMDLDVPPTTPTKDAASNG